MPINLVAVPAGGRTRIPLDQIDPDIIDAIEEAYTYCRQNPGTRLQTDPFLTKDDAERFLKEARSYAYWRGESHGRLTVTGNTAKDPNGGTGIVARFTVAEFIADEGAEDTPVSESVEDSPYQEAS